MKKVFAGMALACLALTGCAGQGEKQSEGCCSDKSNLEVVLGLHRKLKPECVSAFKASFAECKESTLKEPGCLDYGLYQSPEDSTQVLIYEVWKNEAELAKHGETAHLKKHVEETKGMAESSSDNRVYALPMSKGK